MTLPPRVTEFIEELPPGTWGPTGKQAFIDIAAYLREAKLADWEVCELLAQAFDGAVVASKV